MSSSNNELGPFALFAAGVGALATVGGFILVGIHAVNELNPNSLQSRLYTCFKQVNAEVANHRFNIIHRGSSPHLEINTKDGIRQIDLLDGSKWTTRHVPSVLGSGGTAPNKPLPLTDQDKKELSAFRECVKTHGAWRVLKDDSKDRIILHQITIGKRLFAREYDGTTGFTNSWQPNLDFETAHTDVTVSVRAVGEPSLIISQRPLICVPIETTTTTDDYPKERVVIPQQQIETDRIITCFDRSDWRKLNTTQHPIRVLTEIPATWRVEQPRY